MSDDPFGECFRAAARGRSLRIRTHASASIRLCLAAAGIQLSDREKPKGEANGATRPSNALLPPLGPGQAVPGFV
jgi:hypothetical protein